MARSRATFCQLAIIRLSILLCKLPFMVSGLDLPLCLGLLLELRPRLLMQHLPRALLVPLEEILVFPGLELELPRL